MNSKEENSRYKRMKEKILKNIEKAIDEYNSSSAASWILTLGTIESRIEID